MKFLLQATNRTRKLNCKQCRQAIDLIMTEAGTARNCGFFSSSAGKTHFGQELYGLVIAMRAYMIESC